MTRYWILMVMTPDNEERQRATIARQPDLSVMMSEPFFSWLSGMPFQKSFPTPLEVQLDGGTYITDFFPPSIPLMSTRMLDGLAQAGVSNIDTYDVVMLDKAGQPLAESFKAINILGNIACADLEASDCIVDNPDLPIGVDFDSLVIDEKKAGEALFFRLYESPNAIVVHDSVKRQLEPLALRGIHFVEPEDWSG